MTKTDWPITGVLLPGWTRSMRSVKSTAACLILKSTRWSM